MKFFGCPTFTAARADHAAAQDRWQQQLDQAASTHREQIAGVEHRIAALTGQLDEHRERLTRAIAEKDAAAPPQPNTPGGSKPNSPPPATPRQPNATAPRPPAPTPPPHTRKPKPPSNVSPNSRTCARPRPAPELPAGSRYCRCESWSTSRFEGVDLAYFHPAISAVPLAAGMLSAVRHSLIADQGGDVVDGLGFRLPTCVRPALRDRNRGESVVVDAVPVPVSTWISQRPRSDGVPFAATAGAAQHCLPVEVGRM